MKILKETKVSKLPFSWQQAIAQNKKRGWTIKNFFLQFLFRQNPFKHHCAFVTDYLIAGSNPLLNFLKLKNLLLEIKNTGDKKIISIININSFDYWGYHAFEKKDVWRMLQVKLNVSFNSIEDFLQSEIDSLIVPENIEIVFINDFNFSIKRIQKDDFLDSYILHLTDFSEQKSEIFSYMNNIFKAENNIKKKYDYLLKSLFSKKQTVLNNIAELSFSDKKKFAKDSQIESHVLCAKDVFFSSMCDIWESVTKEAVLSILDEDVEVTIFKHWLYDKSCGSAKKIANSFTGLEFLALSDFIESYKRKL